VEDTHLNPIYITTRFKVEWPHHGRPLRFGVVTAWNPDGRDVSPAENALAHARLRARLEEESRVFFSVTGGSPDFSHAEPGYGIVFASCQEAVALGRAFRQEAVFWVEADRLQLVSCAYGQAEDLGAWSARVSPASNPPAFHFLGNIRLLEHALTALFCSNKCPGDRILPAHDQAKAWREAGTPVISGFHSPVERDCLRILLRGKSPVVVCPARSLDGYRLPAEWKTGLELGRLLLLSPFAWGTRRQTQALAGQRNQFVASLAHHGHLVYAHPGGSLAKLGPLAQKKDPLP
jgi:hypothetical protein